MTWAWFKVANARTFISSSRARLLKDPTKGFSHGGPRSMQVSHMKVSELEKHCCKTCGRIEHVRLSTTSNGPPTVDRCECR